MTKHSTSSLSATSPSSRRPEAAPRPYDAPTLRAYGSVSELTAGPESGHLDQIAGSSGGFLASDPGSIDIARPDGR